MRFASHGSRRAGTGSNGTGMPLIGLRAAGAGAFFFAMIADCFDDELILKHTLPM